MSLGDWIRGAEIEPSLYAADFSRLGEQISALLDVGCRVFHFDVGDGHFVEPITIGPIVLQSISPLVHARDGKLDVHLMVERPAKYFEAIAAAGGDSATFHFEAVDDVGETIREAHGHGLRAGVAFSPETEPEPVAAAAEGAELVLCMAIHPGYSGQAFREETFARVERLRAALPDPVQIQVDGGVGEGNVAELRARGATLLVAGSSIFSHQDPAAAYRRLADLSR
jgi:ribulose-phosphate 3-epimerase